jgi:hypothetical protein
MQRLAPNANYPSSVPINGIGSVYGFTYLVMNVSTVYEILYLINYCSAEITYKLF